VKADTDYDPATGAPEAAPIGQAPTHADIAVLAQHIYEEEGCPFGREQAHWFEAERRLRQQATGREPEPVAAVSAHVRFRLYSG
jgi:hypothetical protein